MKRLIDDMFYILCRSLVLSDKGGETLIELYNEYKEAEKAAIICRLLETAMLVAREKSYITENEYNFVQLALVAVAHSMNSKKRC